MQKLEKLIDVAAEALSLYIRKTTAELGESLPLDKPTAAAAPAPKARKPRAPKKETAEAAAIEGPFGPIATPAKVGKTEVVSVEDQAEAKRRCQEVMGLFIRRYLKAQPTGLDRAKIILTQECGRPIAKLEDLTHVDNVKLIPRFEAELEKAA